MESLRETSHLEDLSFESSLSYRKKSIRIDIQDVQRKDSVTKKEEPWEQAFELLLLSFLVRIRRAPFGIEGSRETFQHLKKRLILRLENATFHSKRTNRQFQEALEQDPDNSYA